MMTLKERSLDYKISRIHSLDTVNLDWRCFDLIMFLKESSQGHHNQQESPSGILPRCLALKLSSF